MNVQFEQLDTIAWKKLLGSDWSESRVRSLDFSGSEFNLTSLTHSEAGLLCPNLNLKHLKKLDLSRNRLTVIDEIFTLNAPFAHSLKKLNLSHNLLDHAFLELPSLTFLDLSYNNLSTIPNLASLPNLEILNLNHNHISKGWDELKNCSKLKELYLTNNQFSMYPSHFRLTTSILQSCPKLTIVKLAKNPISNWFPEYEILLRIDLPHLKETDHWSTRDGVGRLKFNGSLEEYDALYFDHIKAFKPYLERLEYKQEDRFKNELPSLSSIVNFLYEGIKKSSDIEKVCSEFLSLCEFLFYSDVDKLWKLFPDEHTNGLQNQKIIFDFAQVITLLIESHEHTREILLTSLTKLSIVPHENLGIRCMEILRDIMKGNSDLEALGSSAINNLLIQSVKGHDYDEPRCQLIIKGLASMPQFPALARKSTKKKIDANLGVLNCIIVEISRFFESKNTDSDIICLMSLAVEYPPNAIELTGQGIPQLIAELMENQIESHTLIEENLILHFLNIAGKCAAQVKRAATLFVKKQIHTKLILERLKLHFRNRQTNEWSLQTAKIVGGMIDFLSGIMVLNEQGLVDCVDHYHLTDLLLIPCKETIADPVVLAASLNCLAVILQQKKLYLDSVKYITEEVSRGINFLQYLGGINYSKICDLAEKHLRQKDIITNFFHVPELSFNSNMYIHKLFTAILKFYFFFLKNVDIPYCQEINQFLATRQREKTIFRILCVPNNDVKLIAIDCLLQVPLENCDADDVGTILKLFKHFGMFLTGDVSKIIVSLLSLLRRFVDDATGTPGSYIRKHYPDETINSVYELLVKAINERSNNYEMEQSKISVCVACVELLRSVSIYPELSCYMRSKEISRNFKIILKAEEEICFPQSQDVAIERCWTGRDVVQLVSCFDNIQKLDPSKKPAFRIMSQLADIFEAKSIYIDSFKPILLQDLVSREFENFSSIDINERLNSLNQLESTDRINSITNFISQNYTEKLIFYVSRLCHPDFESRLAYDRKNNLTAEYWAGRLKAEILDTEQAITSQSEPIEMKLLKSKSFRFSEVPPTVREPHKWKFMEALHRLNHLRDPALDALFMYPSIDHSASTSIWKNVAKGLVRPLYIIVALFRFLYCGLTLPHKDIKTSIRKTCQKPLIIRKLLSLLEVVPLFDCYSGAKLFTVIRLAFQVEPYKSLESMDLIISYHIVSKSLQRLLQALYHRLCYSRTKFLSESEEVFTTETIKLVSTICKQTTLIKFSNNNSIQLQCVELSLKEFVDIIIIKSIIQSVIYSLAVSVGSTRGTFIEHVFPSDVKYREEMRDFAIKFFSTIIVYCSSMKHPQRNLFLQLEVEKQSFLRRSYLFEIFDSVQTSLYSDNLQISLSLQNERAERALLLAPVYTYFSKSSKPTKNVLFVTNFAIYVCQRPSNVRNYKESKSTLEEISIQYILTYDQITQVIGGYPFDQVMILGWKKDPQAAETFSIVIFDKVSSTLPTIQCICGIARDYNQNNVLLSKDMLSYMAVKSTVNFEGVVCSSIVLKRVINFLFQFHGQTSDGDALVLHILTKINIYEFTMNWSFWSTEFPGKVVKTQVLTEDVTDLDFLDVRKSLSQNIETVFSLTQDYTFKKMISQESFIESDVSVDEYLKINFENDNSKHKIASNELKNEDFPHLRNTATYSISDLTEVKFGQSSRPVVEYIFTKKSIVVEPVIPKSQEKQNNIRRSSNSITEHKVEKFTNTSVLVKYLNDTSRERWRCGVAKLLNESELAGLETLLGLMEPEQIYNDALKGLHAINHWGELEAQTNALDILMLYIKKEGYVFGFSETYSIFEIEADLIRNIKNFQFYKKQFIKGVKLLSQVNEELRKMNVSELFELRKFKCLLEQLIPLLESELELRNAYFNLMIYIDFANSKEIQRLKALWNYSDKENYMNNFLLLKKFNHENRGWYKHWEFFFL